VLNSLRKAFGIVKHEVQARLSVSNKTLEVLVEEEVRQIDIHEYEKIKNQSFLLGNLNIKLKEERDEATTELNVANTKMKELQSQNKEQKIQIQNALESEKNSLLSYENCKSQLDQVEKKFRDLENKYEIFRLEKNKAIEDKYLIEKKFIKLKEELQSINLNKEKNYLEIKALTEKNSKLITEVEKQKNTQEIILKEKNSVKDEEDKLILHLHTVQEELERYYFLNKKLQAENEVLKSRWERIQKRIPNYFDFKNATAHVYDLDSENQGIVWDIKDYVHSNGVVLSEIAFKTILSNGVPSISLYDPISKIDENLLLPQLALTEQAAFDSFKAISTSQWQKFSASINILEHGLATGWKSFGMSETFDPSFYKDYLTQLISSFKRLPEIMRFNKVKLKRELQNLDYEHLWLEVYGLTYKQKIITKIEMRIGAQLEKGIEFSQLPKYEFPLIDGKLEPFESWYAESVDDFGGKFELRFSLDKGIFDFSTWAKLSSFDRELTHQLIHLMPTMLEQMIEKKVPINRDWNQWLSLSKKSSDLLTNLIKHIREEKKSKEGGSVDLNGSKSVLTVKSDTKEFDILSKKNLPQENRFLKKTIKLDRKIK
jgi:hypothetical protein